MNRRTAWTLAAVLGLAAAPQGAAAGLASTESQVWTQNSAGLAGTALAGDRFGAGLGN